MVANVFTKALLLAKVKYFSHKLGLAMVWRKVLDLYWCYWDFGDYSDFSTCARSYVLPVISIDTIQYYFAI